MQRLTCQVVDFNSPPPHWSTPLPPFLSVLIIILISTLTRARPRLNLKFTLSLLLLFYKTKLLLLLQLWFASVNLVFLSVPKRLSGLEFMRERCRYNTLFLPPPLSLASSNNALIYISNTVIPRPPPQHNPKQLTCSNSLISTISFHFTINYCQSNALINYKFEYINFISLMPLTN